MLASEAWVPLAEVARAHGVAGELRVRPYNQDSTLLLELERVLVRRRIEDGGQDAGVEMFVEGARWANGAILMKLRSVDDRDAAEGLRAAVVCARRGDFPDADEGEFYACDVEGARVVVEGPDGPARDLGFVRELRTYPSTAVLVVEAGDGGPPWEIPLVEAFVRRVDVDANLVTLATVEGLERG